MKGNQVALTGLLQEGLSFYGEYNEEESTITFPVQQIYGSAYPQYYLCSEIWGDDGIVFNAEKPVVAKINEDGTITFDGWTILYVYDDGSVYAYFSSVVSQMSVKKETGIKDVIDADSNSDAPAIYYNLQGIRMQGDNMRPGIYIMKKGNKTQKILVK